jgi:hypothetical protein
LGLSTLRPTGEAYSPTNTAANDSTSASPQAHRWVVHAGNPNHKGEMKMNPQNVPTLEPQRSQNSTPENSYQSAPTPEPVYDQQSCYTNDEALEPASGTTEEETR